MTSCALVKLSVPISSLGPHLPQFLYFSAASRRSWRVIFFDVMEIPFFLGRLEELASGELEALWSRPRDWVFTALRPRAMIASMGRPREDVMTAALRALAFI